MPTDISHERFGLSGDSSLNETAFSIAFAKKRMLEIGRKLENSSLSREPFFDISF